MPPTSDDLEIFVFPAANPTAQENLLKSIENPIQPESTIFDGFEEMNEALHDELERIKDTAGGFYAWGAEPRGRQTLHGGRWPVETMFWLTTLRVIIMLHESSHLFTSQL